MTAPIIGLLLAAQLAAAPQPAQAPKPSATTPPAAAAQVEIVLFSDFQCPYCAMFSKPFRDIQQHGVDGVKTTVTFRNFPLVIHPRAQLAHQAAVAAAQQGKFWEMHDLLFANQQRPGRDDLIAYAKQLGLDSRRFLSDLDSARVKQAIDADKAEGEKRGISGTPTFYVNGKEYVGTKSFEQLKQIIEGEQRRAVALAEITDDLLSTGPSVATVAVEFFADLQSPVSRPAVAVLQDVMKRYPGDVRVQFRNFPLAFHPEAALAHEAAMTAARQGRFWEFATFVLDHQDALREQDLIALAGRLGLDETAFADTLQHHRYAGRVEADLQDGARRGIRGSPVILVNGKRIDGVPSLKTLTDYVDAELTARRAAGAQQ